MINMGTFKVTHSEVSVEIDLDLRSMTNNSKNKVRWMRSMSSKHHETCDMERGLSRRRKIFRLPGDGTSCHTKTVSALSYLEDMLHAKMKNRCATRSPRSLKK